MPRVVPRPLVPLVVTAVLAAVPSAANGAARYASPTGSGDCSSEAHPCDLAKAINNASPGDSVYVRGDQGDYLLGASGLGGGDTVHVHGTHGRPRLIFSGSVGLSPGAPSGTVNHLYVEVQGTSSGARALLLSGGFSSADDIIAKAAGGGRACLLINGTLTNSVCWLAGSGGPAAVDSKGSTNVLRNVTAYATGSGVQDGVHVEGDSGQPGHDTLVNVIAHGSAIGHDLSAQTNGTGSAAIETSHTNYTTTSVFGAGAGFVDDDPHQTALPKLVDPVNGDFHQKGSSPTVDHGANSMSNGLTDFDGDVRTFNGITDIGADERVGPPTATTGAATGVTVSAATLHGTVNPHGGFVSYRFDYGKTPAYGHHTSTNTLSAGTSAQQAAAALTGLTPHTRYFFRIVAANSIGTATGTGGSFATTAPFGVAIVSKQATLKKGKVGISLRCPVQASGSCKGTLSLKTAKEVKLGSAKKGFLALGKTTFSIPAGKTAEVPVKLSTKGRKLLKTRKTLLAVATAAAHDSIGRLKTTTGNVKLKRAKKKH